MAKKQKVVAKLEAELHKNLLENFKVLRFIYAVSFVIGYRELLIHFRPGVSVSIEFIVGAVILLFLAIRFLWGVGNIRRFVLELIPRNLDKKVDDNGNLRGHLEHVGITRFQWMRIMAFDVPILLCHSFLFFFLAQILVEVDQQTILETKDDYMYKFIRVYASLLLINSIWLNTLKAAGQKRSSESKWMLNNIVFGLFGWLMFIAGWFEWVSATTAFFIAMSAFFINSMLDFYMTGWAYIVGKPG
ncbi:hypothetical protein [Kangiella sediminilitoris]|uniref:Uncharacterized protein n=1 Tax=Kangiella sediminilitoris TaxID=1144748 RepID=A0A1B3B7Y7_9GAMM|nr:hypothetical protein [Kangiella sediminilitoris]AOE48905.1 hypothetical protein KS2013_177 [Kangiella sediminilitoris]